MFAPLGRQDTPENEEDETDTEKIEKAYKNFEMLSIDKAFYPTLPPTQGNLNILLSFCVCLCVYVCMFAI